MSQIIRKFRGVQRGESLNKSLKKWEASTLWPNWRREDDVMHFPEKLRLWNQLVAVGWLEMIIFLYDEDHDVTKWEVLAFLRVSAINWSIGDEVRLWIRYICREGHSRDAVDLASLSNYYQLYLYSCMTRGTHKNRVPKADSVK